MTRSNFCITRFKFFDKNYKFYGYVVLQKTWKPMIRHQYASKRHQYPTASQPYRLGAGLTSF